MLILITTVVLTLSLIGLLSSHVKAVRKAKENQAKVHALLVRAKVALDNLAERQANLESQESQYDRPKFFDLI